MNESVIAHSAGAKPASRAPAWLDRALRRSPAQAAFEWRAARRLTVLAYHDVSDPQRFADHIDYVKRATHPVSLDEAIDAFAGRRALPRRATLVTFDDGDPSIAAVAADLMRERAMPGVVFVIGDLIDGDRPPWWIEGEALFAARARRRGETSDRLEARREVERLKALPNRRRLEALAQLRASTHDAVVPSIQLSGAQLRGLESAGIAVGSHTATHPSLPRCTADEVRDEIVEGHRRLTASLGHAPRSFAYPYGNRDPRAAAILRELGYGAAFLFDHRVSPLRPRDAMEVSRVRVNSYTYFDRFRIILSGLHPAVHRLRGGR